MAGGVDSMGSASDIVQLIDFSGATPSVDSTSYNLGQATVNHMSAYDTDDGILSFPFTRQP
jgi:hypothetical protein